MSSGGEYMEDEKKYSREVGSAHLKKLGQFFTPYEIADFMCRWALVAKGRVLDPAVGNAIFLKTVSKLSQEKRELVGYEIDPKIVEYFDVGNVGDIRLENYLTATWDDFYDCILCNPPYNRFQSINDRDQIYAWFAENGFDSISRYTNQYILFLIKAMHQLNDGGRLAFIIPSEFLNSKYGKTIKNILVQNRYLKAVINFQNDKDIFFNSLTTCCIVLVEKSQHAGKVEFVNLLNKNEIELLDPLANEVCTASNLVSYEELEKQDKWLAILKNEDVVEYNNTVECKTFFKASRGIATGDNDYFLFSINKALQYSIGKEHLRPCVCKSADAKRLFFESRDYEQVLESGRNAYVLDVDETKMDENILDYLAQGETLGVNKKYLPSHRTPWYKAENGKIAPIWVVSAGRGEVKIVRNLAQLSNLTTFHGIIVKEEYLDLTDVIFSYLVTPIGQTILKQNKKELGGGLDKFQPNDINDAKMLDIRRLEPEQVKRIEEIYQEMVSIGDKTEAHISELNKIFETLI